MKFLGEYVTIGTFGHFEGVSCVEFTVVGSSGAGRFWGVC